MQERKEGVLTMYVQAMRKKRSINRNKWKMSKQKKRVEDRMEQAKGI
jgi:hypothetical protein